jgi:hypothetical protein
VNATEYVLVLVSIVVGLGLTDVLMSFHRLLRAGRRVRWDWAAPLAAVLVLLTLVLMWWGFYPHEGRGPTTIGAFLPQLVIVILLFLLSAAALPDEVPPEGLDLRAYYDRNGPYFWGLYAATLAWLMGAQFVGGALAGAPLAQVARSNLVEFGILAVFVSLAVVRRRWWHAVGFLILSTGPIGWVSRSIS